MARPQHPVSKHLIYMAHAICKRKVRSLDEAAREALSQHGDVASVRTLTRRYTERRRELEIAAMREAAVVRLTWDFHDSSPVSHWQRVPDYWERWFHQAEALAAADTNFLALAFDRTPAPVKRHQNRRKEPGSPQFQLWEAHELLDLFAAAGVEPEKLPESD